MASLFIPNLHVALWTKIDRGSVYCSTLCLQLMETRLVANHNFNNLSRCICPPRFALAELLFWTKSGSLKCRVFSECSKLLLLLICSLLKISDQVCSILLLFEACEHHFRACNMKSQHSHPLPAEPDLCSMSNLSNNDPAETARG